MPLDEGVFSVSEREPGEGAGERPERDPVNHHPPEEWRPGDPGDPVEGGAQPPGEPEHGFPDYGPPLGETRRNGGPSPDQPFGGSPPGTPPPIGRRYDGPPSGGQPSGGQPSWSQQSGGHTVYQPPAEEPRGYGGPPPGGQPSYEPPGGHPTGGPPEPVDPGELSEGPSGPGGAGPEHQGYAPGYGEYPSEPVEYGPPGGYGPPGQGGYGPPPPKPAPWGKIAGISCGVLLLLLLVLGGCATLLLVTANGSVPGAGGDPGTSQPGADGQEEAEPSEAEVSANSTEFEPSSVYVSGEYTSVEVSVTNAGAEALDINPLYFTVVDTEGVEHDPGEAIAMDANELDVQTLDPGQSASGAITVAGQVEPESVLFEPFFTGPVEVPVA